MPLRQLFPIQAEEAEGVTKIDIIAVHGLNPRSKNDGDHAYDTWQTPSGSKGILWLRDNLPPFVPGARIFLYEYNATAVYGQDRDTFIGKANELLEAIRIKRNGIESRPILLLGHSMGGLLIKQALINAHNNSKYTTIKDATSGLAFFATPHHGGDWKLVSLGGVAAKIAKMLGFRKGEDILETLKKGSIFSEIMHEQWRQQLLKYDIVSFWGSLDDIVPMDSARLGMPGDRENVVKLNADHRGVCKFGQNQIDQDNFELVRSNIRDLYDNALKAYKADPQDELNVRTTPKRSSEFDYLSDVGFDLAYSIASSLLPFFRNENFVGRESHLQDLEQWFSRQKIHRRMSIYGLGGCGKTALALEFTYRILEKHSDCLVFWVPAISRETFERAYREIGCFLQIPGITDINADIKQLVKRSLDSGNCDWLMIVDNADDTSVLFKNLHNESQSSQLIKYLPKSERGSILFTTRDRKTADRLTQSSVLELKDMSHAGEAKKLMALQISNKTLLVDNDAIDKLLSLLTYLPLAIMQSTAFINQNEISVSEYVSFFADPDTEAQIFSKHFENPNRYERMNEEMDEGMDATIAKTWYISFTQIRKKDELAAKYLSFMACIDRINIPLSLLPASSSTLEQIEALGTLKGYGFITERRQDLQQSKKEKLFDVHRLVHLASKRWLEGHDESSNWNKKFWNEEVYSRLRAVLPYDGHEKRDIWINYISHAMVVAEPRNCPNEKVQAAILGWVGYLQSMSGQYNAAEKALRQVFSLKEKVLGGEHPETLGSMAHLVWTYNDQGRHKEAQELGIQILAKRKRVLGNEHPDTLTSMRDLARTYIDQRRCKEAEELLVQASETRKRKLGDEHPDTLRDIGMLAITYISQGRWKEAEKLALQVLETTKRISGDEHPDTLRSIGDLALTYMYQGRWNEAEELVVKVLKTRKRVLGDKHPFTLNSMSYLALTYYTSGQKESAIALMNDVVSGWEVTHSSHPDSVASKACLQHWLEDNDNNS